MKKRVPRTVQRVRELLKGMTVGMLTTQTAAGDTQSRPMLVQDVDEQGWLWFLTDRTSRKACELSQNPHAAVLFQSAHGDRYVSVHGTAVVVKDDLKVRRIWNPTYRAWFPKGRKDPEIVLIAVKIARVDYWLVPRTRLLRAAGAAKALLTGRRYEAGGHGTLQLLRA
jgi:general stress protein 26